MAETILSEETPFHLQGNFAPIFEEHTVYDLEVTGAIPPELNGRFFRNGSNPKTGKSFHWFLGDGMIHGVRIENGKASWYRNRYVRTPLLADPSTLRTREDGTTDHSVNFANTHVIRHAGRIFALEEGGYPTQLDGELETIGPWDFDGRLRTAMTAHPRVCPETGELLFFGGGMAPPYLTYHRVSKDGELVQSEPITIRGPVMMHDWNVTRNHVIFMDLPMLFDPARLASGGMPIYFDQEYGARLGVMPRDGTDADVVWYEIDPCYVFHPMNAFERGDDIVLDVAKLTRFEEDGSSDPPRLHRWTIHTATGKVTEDALDEKAGEFPRVNDRVVGLDHRYGYMTGIEGDMTSFGGRGYKYDMKTGEQRICQLPEGQQAGEFVFAADPGGSAEDDGWLMTFVYDAARDLSDLVVIDAAEFEKGPIARIHLPTRVPFGFHGSWLAEEGGR